MKEPARKDVSASVRAPEARSRSLRFGFAILSSLRHCSMGTSAAASMDELARRTSVLFLISMARRNPTLRAMARPPTIHRSSGARPQMPHRSLSVPLSMADQAVPS